MRCNPQLSSCDATAQPPDAEERISADSETDRGSHSLQIQLVPNAKSARMQFSGSHSSYITPPKILWKARVEMMAGLTVTAKALPA